MRLFYKHFIILFLLVALQMQSFPAMAALLCQDNLLTRMTNHQLSHTESHANQQADFSDSECDDCVYCHVSISYGTPLDNPVLSITDSTTISLFYIPHFYQFISELPQHPPKNSRV